MSALRKVVVFEKAFETSGGRCWLEKLGSGLLKVKLLGFRFSSLLLGPTTYQVHLQNALVIMNELPAV